MIGVMTDPREEPPYRADSIYFGITDEYVHAYLQGAGLSEDKKAFLFRSAKGRGGHQFASQERYLVHVRRVAVDTLGTCSALVIPAPPQREPGCGKRRARPWASAHRPTRRAGVAVPPE